ncbi:MAG: hypothetical protein ABI767_08165 [Rhodanobacter sp.]
MQQLSSQGTWFRKRMSPLLCFGFILIFPGISLWSRYCSNGMNDLSPALIFVLVCVFTAGVGWVAYRHLIFDRVDQVWLDSAGSDGDLLPVKHRGEKRRVALSISSASMPAPTPIRAASP